MTQHMHCDCCDRAIADAEPTVCVTLVRQLGDEHGNDTFWGDYCLACASERAQDILNALLAESADAAAALTRAVSTPTAPGPAPSD